MTKPSQEVEKLSKCWLTPGQLILRNFGSKRRIIPTRTNGSSLMLYTRMCWIRGKKILSTKNIL
ncbi:hypothetical protein LSL_1964 (plasmid) [Ligilactobacillus salivarius UCC118]|uniref:Uncharacterized protein n=1 Tax=Ligilactobacillus salivarius (strain UCC118) TaxID=362948 RepID=A0A3B2_LIGS1|nr:hypothetical protein LSL_1964 [Ligilactobacillus salivarius UCC118]OQR09834.1 hypothetical protein B6U44_08630 [Ligilactobacillus salivarius]OQR18737.1 hypothetical protein B6U40_09020 [Ligilactobacillus salivarius]